MEIWKRYEYYCIDQHKRQNPTHSVRHWSHIPDDWLSEAGWLTDRRKERLKRIKSLENGINPYTTREYGLDGMALTPEGVYEI